MNDRRPDPSRGRGDVPLWRQAAEGIGIVTAGALLAILASALLAAVVSWLF